MKTRILMLIVLLFFLNACASKKITSNSREKTKVNVQHDVSLKSSDVIEETINMLIEKAVIEQLDVEIERVQYDTDKPSDPTTGKPPVKETEKTKIRKETKGEEKGEIGKKTEQKKQEDAADKSIVNKKNDNKGNETTTTGMSPFKIAIISFCVGLVVAIVIIIVRKVKRRLKPF